MSKQFLRVPVENARELVQRKIDSMGSTLWAGKTVTYIEEVILPRFILENLSDPFAIYFGTFVTGTDASQTALKISDEDTVSAYTFNESAIPLTHGSYNCIIMNHTDGAYNSDYFYGYKFSITQA